MNRSALDKCRAQQQRLVDGEIWTVSNAMLFDVNSRLHQAIITCSGNSFFIDSLKRIDTLRRLMDTGSPWTGNTRSYGAESISGWWTC